MLVNFLLDLRFNQTFNISLLDAAPFDMVKVFSQVLAMFLRISLSQVNPLLGSASENPPPQFVGKNPLSLGIDATTDRLKPLVVREKMKIGGNNIGDLLGLAKRVTKCNGKTILGDGSNSSTSPLVMPVSGPLCHLVYSLQTVLTTEGYALSLSNTKGDI